MALTIDFSITSYTEDLDTGTLTDATTYGGAEVARADAGVFMIGLKIDSSAVETDLLVTNEDPNAATTWTFPSLTDGWHGFVLFVVDDYAGGTTYAANDLVFDVTTKGMYLSLAGSNTGNAVSNATWWELKTMAEVYALLDTAAEPANIEYGRLDTVVVEHTDKGFSDLAGDTAIDICNNCNLERDVEAYEQLGLFLDGMSIFCIRAEYSNGEVVARRAEDLI